MSTFPPVTKHQAFRDLGILKCSCGSKKARMMSHCRTCYFKLPAKLRSALYSTHDDYVGPYNQTLTFLGHESPSAREDRLAAEAANAGMQVVIHDTQLHQEASTGASAGINNPHQKQRTP
jgi:hypothetical protein